jgi:hypothetical protein
MSDHLELTPSAPDGGPAQGTSSRAFGVLRDGTSRGAVGGHARQTTRAETLFRKGKGEAL